MKKINLSRLDLDLYQETLENGLQIYVVPMTNRKNIYASFATKFGSKESTFIPLGEDDYLTVSDGIAHFLEHKLFASESGADPMSFFAANGASNNAMTDHDSTVYIFDGPVHFNENMEFLLNFVQEPYFTDENVLKEQGIIAEELKMYHDNPESRLVETLQYNTFTNHPKRLPIGGTIESISKITKEELYRCYNTFYHPSNMFVVVTGNVVPEEVIEVIKNNQAKKTFLPFKEIKIAPIVESDKVSKPFEEIKMDIELPKVGISFKFNYNGHDLRDFLSYTSLFFATKFGTTSLLREKLMDLGIITESLSFHTVETDNHVVNMIFAETKEPERLLEYIKEELKNKDFTEEDLLIKKNVLINKIIKSTDSIYAVNEALVGNIVLYGDVRADIYEYTKSLNIRDANKILDGLTFDNTAVVIVKPLIDNAS